MNTIHDKTFKSVWKGRQTIECWIEQQNTICFNVKFRYLNKLNSLNIVPGLINLHMMMRAYLEETRDRRFGERDPNNERGVITTPADMVAFIEMLAHHAMRCLGSIMDTYGVRMATEYAMWYLRTKSGEIEYTMTVQQMVCDFIVGDDMLAPDVKFGVPEWDAKPLPEKDE
jgi:hypothetical protein